MSDVKSGMWRDILLRLPAESLLRLRAVCKRWRTAIDDPVFVKAHTNFHQPSISHIIIRNSTGPPFCPLYYFNLQDLKYETKAPQLQTIPVTPLNLTRSGLSSLRSLPVAACNGLLLLLTEGGDWEIRNPLTRERLKLLPRPTTNSKVLGYGLGYDSASDDYKAVVFDYCLLNSTTQTHVYSLKSPNSWKKIGNCPFGGLLLLLQQQRGVFLNGALHWLSDDGIVVLDVGAESYRRLAIPDFERRPKSTMQMQLEALSGCLFLTHRFEINNGFGNIDAWVMSYGKENSWMKLNTSNIYSAIHREEGDLRPLAYLKNKRRVFLNNDNHIFWLDFEDSKKILNKFKIHAVCSKNSRFSAQAFVGSLFRLHGVTEPKHKKNTSNTKLTFNVREQNNLGYNCYGSRKKSNWYHPTTCHGGKEKTRTPNIVDTLSFVPLDICREIFFHLPAKSLIRFRAVCFAWRSILDDPGFVKAHTNKQLSSTRDMNIIIRTSTGPPFYPLYSLDLDDLDFTDGLQRIAVTSFDSTPLGVLQPLVCPDAACNGLMLIHKTTINRHTYEIWNPLTQECLELRKPKGKLFFRVGNGIGYDYASDDYKVVLMYRRFLSRRSYKIQTLVYSLRTDSWRNIGDIPLPWKPSGVGIFFCGALHWMLPSAAAGEVEYTILSFDLGTESYQEMQLPSPHPSSRKRRYLSVLGDCLILSDHSDTHFVVWVMKGYGDEDYSWVKLFSIDSNVYKIGTKLRPVTYIKDKTQVFLQDDDFGFFVFDLERNSMKKVCIHGLLTDFRAQFIPGTIFRLRDNCGATGKRRRRTIMKRVEKIKLSNTELYFCVRDAKSWGVSHDGCHSLDSNWDYLSSEDEEEKN